MKLLKFLPFFLLSILLISCEDTPVGPEPSEPEPEPPQLKCEVTVSISNLDINIGDTQEISASVSSPNDTECGNIVSWSTSDTSIVSITAINDTSATIKALTEGHADIIATVKDKFSTDVYVTVKLNPVIAYHKLINRPEDIWVADIYGNEKQITDDKDHQYLSPQWIDGSDKIAFFSNGPSGTKIYSVNASGNNKRVLVDDFSGIVSFDIYSNNEKIVIAGKIEEDGPYEIYTKNLKSGENTRITFENEGKSGMSRPPGFAEWSPNGEKIVFQSFRNGNWELYTVNEDGSDVTNITNTPNINEYTPSWSPNDSKIVFVSESEGTDDDINIMNINGSQRRIITKGIYPSWANDGKIVFSKTEGNRDIASVRIDGSGFETIVAGSGSKTAPSWRFK